MGSVSIDTSRAIYEDALRAYSDSQHPCYKFRFLQPELAQAEWQLPEPFNGHSADRGIVFLGLNPKVADAKQCLASARRLRSGMRFYRHRFDNEPSNWALLYRHYQALGEIAVGPGSG